MYLEFAQMPAHARIWVYQSDRKFKQDEVTWIESHLKNFCENWNTHGAKMPTSFTLKFDQVIIFSVDESQLGASGCSIDSSVRILREIEQKFGVNLLDQGKVGFLADQNNLTVNSVFGIKSSLQQGFIQPETLVLNPLVKEKADLEHRWLVSAKDSWLNKFFVN